MFDERVEVAPHARIESLLPPCRGRAYAKPADLSDVLASGDVALVAAAIDAVAALEDRHDATVTMLRVDTTT